MADTPQKEKPALKVYGSHGYWRDERNKNRHQQARFIVASPSKAAIYRAYPELRNNEWGETGNEAELKVAPTRPMALFARGLNDWAAPYVQVQDYEKSVRR